jgi:hypothetical protein
LILEAGSGNINSKKNYETKTSQHIIGKKELVIILFSEDKARLGRDNGQ